MAVDLPVPVVPIILKCLVSSLSRTGCAASVRPFGVPRLWAALLVTSFKSVPRLWVWLPGSLARSLPAKPLKMAMKASPR